MTSCRWAATVDETESSADAAEPLPLLVDHRLPASFDRSVIGYSLRATVRVRLSPATRCAGFERWLDRQVDIVEVFRCAGAFDYEMRLACRDRRRLDAMLAAIRLDGGAAETETTLLLDRVTENQVQS